MISLLLSSHNKPQVLIELIKKVYKTIFCTYTKTFGGKIWVNLHKNLNRCRFKFPAKTYLNNISCEKIFSRITSKYSFPHEMMLNTEKHLGKVSVTHSEFIAEIELF